MLKMGLVTSPDYWCPVRASVIAEDGRRADVSFEVKFKRHAISELIALRDRLSTASEPMSDADAARELVVDWRGVLGDDDQPLPFTPENLDRVIQAGLAGAIGAAFWASHPRSQQVPR